MVRTDGVYFAKRKQLGISGGTIRFDANDGVKQFGVKRLSRWFFAFLLTHPSVHQPINTWRAAAAARLSLCTVTVYVRPGLSVSRVTPDSALMDMDLGADPTFRVGDWVEVMRLDGNDVRYGEIVACWAQLSPAERCGSETRYRTTYLLWFRASDRTHRYGRSEMYEIIDALPQ